MDNVQLIDRVFDTLECLSRTEKSMGPSELAKGTGIHKSTVHRILGALLTRGYVEKAPENGKYRLSVKVVELASNHIDNLELHTEARPYLNELSKELDLTVHLGILDRCEVIYAEKIDTFKNLRIYTEIGNRVPAYCSSLGKCLLSRASGEELEELLAKDGFTPFTPNTITTIAALKKHLKDVRAQGWAIDDEEHELGHRCIGAPIFDYRGEIIAAVSASGATVTMPSERIPQIVKTVRNTAMLISRRLGYID